MRERAKGLEWLKAGDLTQMQWATTYLKKKGKLQVSPPFREHVTYKNLLTEGLELEKTAEGVRILQAMRAAWRQREYRQPEHGRRPYTFTLTIETKHLLSKQAEKCGHHEAEHLTALIERGAVETIFNSKTMQALRTAKRKAASKAKAEAAFQQLRAQELEEHLKQCLKDRFVAEHVAGEELERKMKREMDRIDLEIQRAMEEHRSTNPRLKHLGL